MFPFERTSLPIHLRSRLATGTHNGADAPAGNTGCRPLSKYGLSSEGGHGCWWSSERPNGLIAPRAQRADYTGGDETLLFRHNGSC